MNSRVRPDGYILPGKAERLRIFGSVDPVEGNKPVSKAEMKDLQNMKKDFLFELQQVGVDNVKYPLEVISAKEPEQLSSIGNFRLTTALDYESKGINMSRLMEQLERSRTRGLSDRIQDLITLTQQFAELMQQPKAELKVTYPWFYERTAPVTGLSGLNHSLAIVHVIWKAGETPIIRAGLEIQITTLCPCSKEISEYSAHNQRGTLRIQVQSNPCENLPSYWKEELLNAAESNASSCLHPILKRPDEKRVTERAYENPRFVEDMVRLTAADLYEKHWLSQFEVDCRNEESIHQHDAVTRIVYDKRTPQ
ncbi:GTP cyclohydrolase I FolE2 [Paenibacillus barcinonensis]|uniref:GTP cyclohydrolase FolE2 n=1 Tax=Paenibacillus barcinonensis TaxID=198119 RepID=A0A2V4V987_PAEBA|nr:GTP cyclohydrolase FolE2 [Paenibacillus barcinonensis]PYE45436.1 GTP cyclohydrolase I [Paenibacillus barcinonensis]QKS55252.1 GTP cyclohydrolase I FolE2 [Paenibacillus barcinonensis]